MLTPRCLLLPFHLSARGGAHDQNRTDDLVLTKDALCRLSYVGGVRVKLRLTPFGHSPDGAGDGIRTRDIQLGRLELYQLSYTRLVRPDSTDRMVGREGFEPSKPEGRQIYSLMRLAASLPPPGIAGYHPRIRPLFTGFSVAARRLELAKGIEPPTR